MQHLYLPTLTALLSTISGVYLLSPLARKYRLLDKPTSRKQHVHQIPLTGGISIYISFLIGCFIWSEEVRSLVTVRGTEALLTFLLCALCLVIIGVLDDKFQLGVPARIILEFAVAIYLMENLQLRLVHLGDLFGLGAISLSPFIAYPFTAIAIFGIVNAFNMLDGMDGLLGSLVIATLGMFYIMTSYEFNILTAYIFASLMAFTISNLQLIPHIPKTFLGDSGSKLVGFIAVSLLLAAASGQISGEQMIQPATALFMVTIPLYDMVYTTLRRLAEGSSPFRADRSHVHHLLQALGLSPSRGLFIITIVHTCSVAIGLTLWHLGLPETVQMTTFIILFAVYCWLVTNLWRRV